MVRALAPGLSVLQVQCVHALAEYLGMLQHDTLDTYPPPSGWPEDYAEALAELRAEEAREARGS